MAASSTKTAVWAVRPDGSAVVPFHASTGGALVVVVQDEQGRRTRWTRTAYNNKFGTSPEVAIEKFLMMATRGVEEAWRELTAAQTLLARAQALAAEARTEPQVQE